MRARVDLHRTRPWVERALALAAALIVTWVLIDRPHLELLGLHITRWTLFPASIGFGVWLPLLARRRLGGLGSITREGDVLVIARGRRRLRVSVHRVRAASVAAGERGASVLLELDDETMIAAAVDDLDDARRFADGLRGALAGDEVMTLRAGVQRLVASVLRPVAALSALGYYLYVVRDAIPGSKPLYGLGALIAASVLLVLHMLRPRARPLAGQELLGTSLWEYPAALRAHLALHARAAREPTPREEPPAPRPRIADPDEPLATALPRLRRELQSGEAYRGPAQAIRARLAQVLQSAEVPLRERAVALRVIADRDRDEVKKRIAEMDALPSDDRAFLEAVALAEDDAAAIERAERRPPEFVPPKVR